MEVVARIRFTTPSLGNARGERRDLMLRNAEGEVVYLQSWWRAGLRYAAQARGLPVKKVDAIQVDPIIRGTTTIHCRFYTTSEYKEHEAFAAGSEVEVHFCLPCEMNVDHFRELLDVAGRFVGISPYGYKQNFGRFIIVSVDTALRLRADHARCADTKKREPDPGLPGGEGTPVSPADVQEAGAGVGQCKGSPI